jgi:hypothetical protein
MEGLLNDCSPIPITASAASFSSGRLSFSLSMARRKSGLMASRMENSVAIRIALLPYCVIALFDSHKILTPKKGSL